jgi:hypothetical protein
VIKTQIQLPDDLYDQVKRLAASKEWSMAEIFRRGAEYMVSLYLDREEQPHGWAPPAAMDLGGSLGSGLNLDAEME